MKTLRNMWMAVSLINPALALLSMGVLPMTEILDHPNDMLARVADTSAGSWLKIAVAIDAAIVLSGAVLTSYVGVTGLVTRMAMDRCLPAVFLHVNSWRKSPDTAIFSFFCIAVSLFFILDGDVEVSSARVVSVVLLGFLVES